MACARPIVASNVSGIPEAVQDGVSGLLVPPRDPASLAQAIERLLADPALRRRLGEHARRRIEAQFTQERMAENAGRIFEGLLERG
jgi:glycosyltransferase involved in cell wall biosynthesis